MSRAKSYKPREHYDVIQVQGAEKGPNSQPRTNWRLQPAISMKNLHAITVGVVLSGWALGRPPCKRKVG